MPDLNSYLLIGAAFLFAALTTILILRSRAYAQLSQPAGALTDPGSATPL